MIDSHTHLHACKPSDDVLVAAALQVGVERIVTVGTSAASCRLALEAAERFPQVYAAIGLHPNDSVGFAEAAFSEIAELAAHERCVAIGETGLDHYRDYAPAADQERAFHAHIELARALAKPLVIHTRAADDDTIRILREHAADLNVILHCFSMASRVEECLEQPNWWFSFSGNITYPKAQELRQAMLRVPAERLLVETDAPYLAPQEMRGRPNEPAYVTWTAQAVAAERRVGYDELERSVRAAAATVFGWSG